MYKHLDCNFAEETNGEKKGPHAEMGFTIDVSANMEFGQKKNDDEHHTEKMITFFIQTEKDKLIRLRFFGSILFTSAP